MSNRCPWCGGVYRVDNRRELDADGEPNTPCACGSPAIRHAHETPTSPAEVSTGAFDEE